MRIKLTERQKSGLLTRIQGEVGVIIAEARIERKRRKDEKFMEKIKGIWDYLEGKKTYIIAIITAVIGLLVASGVEIPESVWFILTALGLGSLRSAVGRSK